MSASVLVPWDEALVGYDFGPDHPLNPLRVDLTMRLARELGVLDLPTVTVDQARAGHRRRCSTSCTSRTTSTRSSVAQRATRRTPTSRAVSAPRTPRPSRTCTRPRPWSSAPRVAAARAVWTGEAEHAVNVAGGLHHAMPGAGERLLRLQRPGDRDRLAAGAGRRAGRLRRRRRAPRRRRRARLLGRAAGADDLAARERAAACSPAPGSPRTAAAPAPTAAPSTSRCRRARATTAGCAPSTPSCRRCSRSSGRRCWSPSTAATATLLDPLAHLGLTVDGQRTSYAALHELAHRYAGGRWVATGGGGYELAQVVPRAWTHLLAEAAGQPGPARRPGARGLAGVRRRSATALAAPARMTDGATPAWARLVGRLRPGRRGRPRGARHPAGRVPGPRPRRAADL